MTGIQTTPNKVKSPKCTVDSRHFPPKCIQILEGESNAEDAVQLGDLMDVIGL